MRRSGWSRKGIIMWGAGITPGAAVTGGISAGRGALWETAKLAIINERNCKQPDRLPEAPDAGLAHGHDHNTEYRMYGNYSGRTIYDPNADLMLPEFVHSRWEPISQAPGFLFDPREKYNPRTLPPHETSGRGY